MRKYLWILIVLFTFKLYSQEIVSKHDVYTENNLVYKVETHQLFTGKLQNFKHKTHLVSEFEYYEGVLKKGTVYFNGKEKIIAGERFYFNTNRKLKREIKYSLDHKTHWLTYFDEKGHKTLEEDYKNGILIYHCSYTNNKKDGIQFSINKKGEGIECTFENGKLIKNNNPN